MRPAAIPWLILFFAMTVAGCSCGGDDDDNDDGDPGDDDDDVDDDDAGSGEDRIANYLRAEPYPRLTIEIDAVDGYALRDDVLPVVEEYFSGILDKPDGIGHVLDGTLEESADGEWTSDELHALGESAFDLDVDAETVKMHVMLVDGEYVEAAGGGTVLGLAWSNTHVALFLDAIEDSCQGVLPGFTEALCANAQTHILIHEFGHVIGLVDNGLPMVDPHKDPVHGDHDADDGCLMYWAYEGPNLVDAIVNRMTGGGGDILFDDACLADIAAVRDAP